MLIKRLNPTTFDVFWNKGWDSWARFVRDSEGRVKQTMGIRMPNQLFQQFRQIVNKKGKQRQIQAAQATTTPAAQRVEPKKTEAALVARFSK